jgi:hypothetical protein
MRAITKPRSERLRSNVPGPAEIRRIARWYDGIALDYRHAFAREANRNDPDAPDEGKLRACMRGEREARAWAATLRAKAAT